MIVATMAMGVIGWTVADAVAQSAPPAAVLQARAYGPSFPAMQDPPIDESGAPSPIVQQSIGCAVVGTGGTIVAVGAGALNLVNVVGGGLVAAVNPGVLAISVGGVVFASFCAVGAALTPLYLHLTEPDSAAPSPAPAQAPGVAFRAGVLSRVYDARRAALGAR